MCLFDNQLFSSLVIVSDVVANKCQIQIYLLSTGCGKQATAWGYSPNYKQYVLRVGKLCSVTENRLSSQHLIRTAWLGEFFICFFSFTLYFKVVLLVCVSCNQMCTK